MKKPNRKRWVNSTKHVHNGITFDSGQELLMYKLLKTAGIKFKYIGGDNARYTVQPEFTYTGGCYERAQKRSKELRDKTKVSKAGYTPDFSGEGDEWFIEVKGRKLGDFNLKWKMFKRALEDSGNPPILFMPVTNDDCKQVIEILKQEGYGRKTS